LKSPKKDSSSLDTRANELRATVNRQSSRAVAWMTIGLGVKRWALLAIVGLLLAILGAALSFAYVSVDFSIAVLEFANRISGRLLDSVALGIACLTLGTIAVVIGLRGVFKAVEQTFGGDFVGKAMQNRRLGVGEKIVAIGGGTGLSTMLRGLKYRSGNITAIVTMADDGGSSGMLREHGMLPPGDLRNCIAALAEAEPLMTDLFQHRFTGLGELKGHSLGNLIMAAMFEMTGDFDKAVKQVSKVLAIRGHVLPSTVDDIQLGAELVDGTQVIGQVEVNKSSDIARVFLIPETPSALPSAVKSIQDAEVIIIGPGSLYTSIIPNLLVPEIANAIKASSAPKIYVCNVMTQPNETVGLSAADHVRAIIRHIGPGVITHVLLNSAKIPDSVLERYRLKNADMVPPDEAEIELLGIRPIHGPFIDVSNVVRHHPDKLASAIYRIVSKI
jgi:uncharacterized cofD-like protein